MSGAEAIVEALKREKVDVVFGIIGGATLPIYDFLRDSGIRHIAAKHEQCAAHAADGYARASGRPGICIATSGPGATNLVTGIANAYMDSSPIIALTGQVNSFPSDSSYMIGRDAFQEADIIGITTPITKYNHQIRSPSEIPATISRAFYLAQTGRPGPVLIDIPKDVQTRSAEMKFSEVNSIQGYKPSLEPHPMQIKRAVNLLINAERPILLAGGGVILSNASSILFSLVEILMAPVATTIMGKGSFPENHLLSLGHIGMHGTLEANKLILEADVLLAVGTRFSDRATGTLSTFCPDAKIIQIDIDSAEIGKNVVVDIPIVADAKKALKSIYQLITQKLKKREKSLWYERIQDFKNQIQRKNITIDDTLNPSRLLMELRKIVSEDTIIATEVGQNQMWAALHLKAYHPRTFITSGGLGTMGFGFPAALGAKVACPNKPVIDVAGDGSFIMTSQDLACSIIEDIPVTVIVFNNSVLGMVAQWQRLFYERRYFAVDLKGLPDFVKLAEAYGAQGVRVTSLKDFSEAVRKAIKSDISTVIDVPISSEEDVFPMVPPSKGLKDIIEG
jgi:acetolactate synthase-1/2/3 large subunit